MLACYKPSTGRVIINLDVLFTFTSFHQEFNMFDLSPSWVYICDAIAIADVGTDDNGKHWV